VVLWWDGLKTRAGSKRQLSNDDDSNSHSARKYSQEQVQKEVDILKKQNGDKYTALINFVSTDALKSYYYPKQHKVYSKLQMDFKISEHAHLGQETINW